MYREKIKTIFLALKVYIVFVLFIILLSGVYYALTGQRPVTTALFGIGLIILAIGLTLVTVADLEEEVPFTIFKDERVQIHIEEDTPRFYNYLFALKHKSKVTGEIDARTGPLDFLIAEYFSWAPFPQLCKSKEYVKIENLESGKKEFGPFDVEAGNYYASFYNKSLDDLVATFQLEGTYRRKPYERWYNLGCTLLEISIPIIVTGLVLGA